MFDQICEAVKVVRSSEYVKLVVLLLQYIQWYCSGEAPCDLPDSIYDYITRGKWSPDPLIDMLANSDISEQAQLLASIVLTYECAEFAGELDDEIEEANNLVFDLLYA